MATTYLHRTTTSTGSNTTATFSGWVKRAKTGVRHVIWAGWESSTERMVCGFESNDHLQMQIYTGGTAHDIETNRVFRDTSAWYHLVFQFDTSNASEPERFKMWVNGVQETSFATDDTITQDIEMKMWGSTSQITIVGARKNSGYEHYFDGEMSHIHIIDGTVYAPTEFGETDSTSGMWRIKTSPSVTYGTNGTFLLKDGAVTTDSSSNSNNYSTGGTLTATKDNPSNNFCTFNSLIASTVGTNTFSNGATIFSNSNASGWCQSGGTLAATEGKYYYEVDTSTFSSGSVLTQFGWGATEMPQITQNLNNPLGKLDVSGGALVNYAPCSAFYDTGAYLWSTTSSHDNQANGSFAATTNTSVIMIAIDLDNGKFYVGKDGTWDSISSSNPSAGTGGKSFTPGGFFYSPYVASHNGGAIKANFGNGYFGSTAIGSPVSAGEGLWKYTPPTNYVAFCTKNIDSA